MGRRYIKRKSDGLVFQSQEEEFFPLGKAQEVALKQGGDLADYEIGIETEENIDAWIKTYNDSAMTYADKRRAEYPDYREYLDAIVKGDEAQKQKYIDDCLAVKAKYPKN